LATETAKTQKRFTAGKKIEGQGQMPMMGSTDEEIGALNRETNAVRHVL